MRQALITGAAGGIGQALARAFREAEYRVIATDCKPQPAGLDCTDYLQVDLELIASDEQYAHEAFARVRSLLAGNGLHALINNAAVQILGSPEKLTRSDWRTTLDVNLLAPFAWIQALLPELDAARGSVVNISSIHARLTKKDFVAYATSKAALSGMTRALAVDLGGRVRVNAIEPAAIETDMLKAGFAGKPEQFAQLEACHPVARIGRAREVAALALYLCGDDAGFISGACIGLDGAVGGRLLDPI